MLKFLPSGKRVLISDEECAIHNLSTEKVYYTYTDDVRDVRDVRDFYQKNEIVVIFNDGKKYKTKISPEDAQTTTIDFKTSNIFNADFSFEEFQQEKHVCKSIIFDKINCKISFKKNFLKTVKVLPENHISEMFLNLPIVKEIFKGKKPFEEKAPLSVLYSLVKQKKFEHIGPLTREIVKYAYIEDIPELLNGISNSYIVVRWLSDFYTRPNNFTKCLFRKSDRFEQLFLGFDPSLNNFRILCEVSLHSDDYNYNLPDQYWLSDYLEKWVILIDPENHKNVIYEFINSKVSGRCETVHHFLNVYLFSRDSKKTRTKKIMKMFRDCYFTNPTKFAIVKEMETELLGSKKKTIEPKKILNKNEYQTIN